ncbi:nucleotide exchange factor sil1 [Lecanora helva]
MGEAAENGGIERRDWLLEVGFSNAQAPAPSPEAHTDLICHTSHASECYPAILQPTEYFQPVHDDQSIPPGLHVRLNLATGLKEARLNVPEPDDAPKADIVLIDNVPTSSEEEQALLSLDNHVLDEKPSQPDDGENFVPPQPPQPFIPTENPEDFIYYSKNAETLFSTTAFSTDDNIALDSLTILTDYAHSQEWGQAMTSDATLSQVLINLVNPSSASPIKIQSGAAQVLGTAIQNNPEALDALLAQSARTTEKPIHIAHAALKASIDGQATAENTLLQKRLLFFLSQLCHDPTQSQLQTFISSSGLSTLLSIFDADSMSAHDGRDIVRAKVANFLLDHIIPVIAQWGGGSPFKDFLSLLEIDMNNIDRAWVDVLKQMGSWCNALAKAGKIYSSVSKEQTEGVSEEAQIVSEAYIVLNDILDTQGCDRGCDCDLFREKVEEPHGFRNEEL